MKTFLKDNICIEDFTFKEWSSYQEYSDIVIYSGKVSDITEEALKECADNKDLLTVKESILSACNEEYCVISYCKGKTIFDDVAELIKITTEKEVDINLLEKYSCKK